MQRVSRHVHTTHVDVYSDSRYQLTVMRIFLFKQCIHAKLLLMPNVTNYNVNYVAICNNDYSH